MINEYIILKSRKFLLLLIFFIGICFKTTFSQEKDAYSLIVKTDKLMIKQIPYKRIDSLKIIIVPQDEEGKPVLNLKEENVVIKKKSKIANTISVVPLTEIQDTKMKILLLVDNSASMEPVIDQVISILDTLVSSLGKGVLVSVAVFDDRFPNIKYLYKGSQLPVRIQKFTKNQNSVRSFYRQGFKDLCSRTYLYDEIYVGLQAYKSDTINVEKNFAIVLSDGGDISSTLSSNYILSNDMQGIVFYTIDFIHSSHESGTQNAFLMELAKRSGGEYFNPKDISSLNAFLQQIATKIVDKGYEVTFEFPKLFPTIDIEFPTTDTKSKPQYLMDFKGLVVEEINIKETFPLLNYVFFEPDNDTIPIRYVLFDDSTKTYTFSESGIKGGTLDHYYNIMNIIGERLRKYPQSIITLVGCNDGIEKGGKILSERRMKNVKQYFELVWKILPDRINVGYRNLPEKPSSPKTPEGMQENRRVEIQCDDWRILKPVTFRQKFFNHTPEFIHLKINPGLDGSNLEKAKIDEWSLQIMRNKLEWNSISGKIGEESKIVYNWKDKSGNIPLDEFDYEILAKIIDNGGDIACSTINVIPVKQLSSEKKLMESVGGKNIEKVSLVLFEFNKAELGVKNDSILAEFVFPTLIDTNLYVNVNGYTDIIGSEQANLKLSENRAKSVHDKIVDHLPDGHTFYTGYGAERPLYDNILPEGRFYNRTVQLIIQDFKLEETIQN